MKKFIWLLLLLLPLSTMASLPPDSIEARTLRQGVACRQPAETVEAFVRRVLPVSCPADDPSGIVQYAWRPSTFGKQLFLSAYDPQEAYRLYVYILDPYQPNTYAVKRWEVQLPISDQPSLQAIFFADADQDGRKELLVLVNSSSREPVTEDDISRYGHFSHYHTRLYGYLPVVDGQRPRYREFPNRPYLDDLETAAEVREVLDKRRPSVRRRRAR
ncbi:hypothetical protein [Hymenobacter rubripertinctus]|uniref:VCBS repeat-containing protein n=1 Tax=Hymenobacter rubripertinctus TaxID=2029981 RepID=A0A418QP08_9BACT|nr:hypothetical protein [Hymenobacter rubripertinctus]RIY06909.1 hypothetical protein D0T11_17940 [Hymenobacter rubripertinctus]